MSKQVRTFATTTADLLALCACLICYQVTQVAIESTGVILGSERPDMITYRQRLTRIVSKREAEQDGDYHPALSTCRACQHSSCRSNSRSPQARDKVGEAWGRLTWPTAQPRTQN